MDWPTDERINNIGLNGNNGEHYEMITTSKSLKECVSCGDSIASGCMHSKVNGIIKCLGCHYTESDIEEIKSNVVDKSTKISKSIFIIIFAIIILGLILPPVALFIILVTVFAGCSHLYKEFKNLVD